MKIQYQDIKFALLTPDVDLSCFDCGDVEINDFIQNDAKTYEENLLAKTYLAFYNSEPIGFFSLAMGSIDAKAVESQDGKKGYRPKKYPAVKIAQMATCKSYQGRDVGKNMLKLAFGLSFDLCKRVGCRVVIVDSKKDEKTVNFYKKYGEFEHFGSGKDSETIPLFRDLLKMKSDERVNRPISDYTEE